MPTDATDLAHPTDLATSTDLAHSTDLATSTDPGATFAERCHEFARATLTRALAQRAGEPDLAAAAAVEFDRARMALHGGELSPVLDAVAIRLGLSADEIELVCLLLAVEFDEPLAQLVVALTEDRDRYRIEIGMLPSLLGLPVTTVGPDSALVRTALLQIGHQPVASRVSVQVAPRVAWGLVGDPSPDPGLEHDWTLVTGGPDDQPGWPRLLVSGGDRIRRHQIALSSLGVPGVLVTAPPATDDGWAALVREATLRGVGLLLETTAAPTAPLSPAGARWIERATTLPIAVSSDLGLSLGTLPHVDWRELVAGDDIPGAEEWAFTLGADVQARHPLTASQLDLMRRALSITGGDEDAAYRRLTDARMDTLATKIPPRMTWDDLVLSPGRTGQLQDLVNRYRHASTVYDEWGFNASPSRGVVALFSGPSGTGKTLSAEVVAGELGLDLYRLDLSSVVSKYIGETQKNLDELFDAASIGNTVLFFDEADSLFGKRTEVSDARDRYANVETSYLLQRLERYDGMVILATNYEKNIDQAFLRRVHTRVAFASPTTEERAELWRHNLRRDVALADDLDLDWLVENFELTGAAIRNAVLDAAFLAAAESAPVSMRHLVRGVAREMAKVGRVINAGQFGPWYEIALSHTGS